MTTQAGGLAEYFRTNGGSKNGGVFVYRLKPRPLSFTIPPMRILLFIFLLLWQVVTPSVGLAQCIGLDDLLVIGAEPTALTVPQVTSRLSPD